MPCIYAPQFPHLHCCEKVELDAPDFEPFLVTLSDLQTGMHAREQINAFLTTFMHSSKDAACGIFCTCNSTGIAGNMSNHINT